MSERRMFAKTIIDSDAFLDMPLSTQALYFHLSMRADDEGFINNPKKIQRMIGATEDDLKLLIAKKFVIAFDTGIIVIKHWKIHNYIRADRITATNYTREREMLEVKDNGSYTICGQLTDICQTDDGQVADRCQQNVSIGKDSIDKDSIGKDKEYIPTTKLSRASKSTYGEYKNVRLKDDEYQKLANDFGESKTKECIDYLDEYIEMKGYKAKSHYLCIRKWVVDAVNEHGKKSSIKPNSFNDISSLRKDSEGFDNIVALIEGGGA